MQGGSSQENRSTQRLQIRFQEGTRRKRERIKRERIVHIDLKIGTSRGKAQEEEELMIAIMMMRSLLNRPSAVGEGTFKRRRKRTLLIIADPKSEGGSLTMN